MLFNRENLLQKIAIPLNILVLGLCFYKEGWGLMAPYQSWDRSDFIAYTFKSYIPSEAK